MLENVKFISPVIHESFRLNNKTFTKVTLETYAHSLIRSDEEFNKDIGDFLLDWLDDEPHIIVSTSGSTGKPKQIKLCKKHMINSAKATGNFFKLPAGSSALLCLSANYIAGKMMLVRAMVLGWKLDTVAPKSNPLDNVFKQYDFAAMVPMQLDNSISRLHLLKKLIVGGGAVQGYLIALIQGVKTKVYETYGMTETVSHIAVRRLNSKKKPISECYFKALPQVVLSTDARNCLIIKAPLVTDEVLVTNDIVELVTYKRFIWKGRYDNVINSGGIKLFPEQIEKKIELVIRQRFFITSVPDKKLGDKLVLIIENITKAISKEVYFEKLSKIKELSLYEIPKEIFFLEQFIETKTNKIHREKTKDLALSTVL